MKILHNMSVQHISWVKSNKNLLEKYSNIENLYFPDNREELQDLIIQLNKNKENFIVIGYSSNTLFLPSFHIKHLICTKYVNKWIETECEIICDCGVSVSELSKYATEKGYIGYEGLHDLPGTVAAAVYGNCGCRGCSINSLLESFTVIDKDCNIHQYCNEDLHNTYRSTTLKRGELNGTILQVRLSKFQGNPTELKKIAYQNHAIRKSQQPTGTNNLGTTFNGGSVCTFKGMIYQFIERCISLFCFTKDRRITYPILLRVVGKAKFVPYIYNPQRYMFLDEHSHTIFSEYFYFYKSIFKDARLEIEIRE